MEYIDYINYGFKIYDSIETEIARFSKLSDAYMDISYSNDVLSINIDCRFKEFEAKIEIRKEEIIRMVLNDEKTPKDAIGELLKEKICYAAHDITK